MSADEALLDRLLEVADGDEGTDSGLEDARAVMDAAERAEGFLQPPRQAAWDLLSVAGGAQLPVFGSYRAVELLDVGGMGAVFRGVRADGCSPGVVAIKALRAEMAAPANIERLRREASVLGRLRHPGIAALHEAGVTEDGRPFLVMEHVRGLTLREHVAHAAPSLRDRLRLLCAICEAVQYAHERLIVHRDLKPANIMITDSGPKLLDFGLSRVLEPGLPALATRTIYRAMTPAYASPEQLRGEPAATPADVYSLGVILYELVTGELPHEPRETIAETLDAVMRPPAPPSALCAECGRDLDAIVLRALSPETDRRYGSALELADDVCAFLEGRPVRARRATRRYVLGKWARRHAVSLTVALTLTAGLVALCAISISLALSLRVKRDEAIRAQATGERINAALARMVESADEIGAGGEEVTVAALLDGAAARVATHVQGDPGAEASIRLTLGRGYDRLGRLEDAAAQFELALGAARAAFGEGDHRTAGVLQELGHTLVLLGATERARPLLEEAMTVRRRGGGPCSVGVAETTASLGALAERSGEVGEAERWYTAAIEMRRGLGDSAGLVSTLTRRARLLSVAGRHDGAIADLLEAMEVSACEFGDPSAQAAASLAELARACQAAGRREEAEGWARRALDMTRIVHGREHPTTTWQMIVLAQIIEAETPGAAEALMREAVGRAVASLGEEHYITAYCRMQYGRLLTSLGRLDEAERELRSAHASCSALFGEGAPNTMAARRLLESLDETRGR